MRGFFFKKYTLGVLLLSLVILHLIAFNIRSKEKLNVVERTVLLIAHPVQTAVNSALKKVKEIWNGYFFLVGLREENSRLSDSNMELKSRLDLLREVEAENLRLRDLLDFAESSENEYITTRVISTGPSSFYTTLIISKGEKDGLKRGMAVLSSKGIVGQISYTTGKNAGVITLSDPNSAIDAIDQRTRARGILRGENFQRLVFEYLPFNEKIDVGDTVVSSGMDGIYPKGIAIGEVEKVSRNKENLFQNVSVRPSVDFTTLEEVLVLLNKPKIVQEEPSQKK